MFMEISGVFNGEGAPNNKSRSVMIFFSIHIYHGPWLE